MVEIEIMQKTEKAVKATVNEAEHVVDMATSESNQDAAKQASIEMERAAKQALSFGRSALGWASGSSSKSKNVTEDIEL